MDRNKITEGSILPLDKNRLAKEIVTYADDFSGQQTGNLAAGAKNMSVAAAIRKAEDVHALMGPTSFPVAGPPFFQRPETHTRPQLNFFRTAPPFAMQIGEKGGILL